MQSEFKDIIQHLTLSSDCFDRFGKELLDNDFAIGQSFFSGNPETLNLEYERIINLVQG